jgi:hypothetical protein
VIAAALNDDALFSPTEAATLFISFVARSKEGETTFGTHNQLTYISA